jgi:hypothetical protein
MNRKQLINSILCAMAAGGLAACGGGGSSSGAAGGGSATISSVGTITGFGSIYVNGIKFDTDNASYRVDDEDRFDDSALAVGMKVRIKGTLNADGRTGVASSVLYDDDVEGPVDTGSLTVVDATTKTFSIFGMQIKADANNTLYDDGASFDTLAEGQNLEISGYFDGTQIVASRIEKQNDLDDEFEVKGTVASYDGATISLTLQNGASAGPFPVSPAAELEIPADPSGLFVEVKLEDQGGGLVAIKIETDDDDLLDDDEDDVTIRGVLVDNGNGGLLINGVPFQVDGNTEYEPASLAGNLVAGMEVKIEGHMQGGVLIAEEVETEDGDIEIEARVIDATASDAKNGTITLDMGNSQSLQVVTDNSTMFEDQSSFDSDGDGSFNLDELAIGSDYLEVEAYSDASGKLIATMVKREDDSDTELEAKIDSYVDNVSVTLLGITYSVDGGTSYEVNDVMVADPALFFGALNSNSVVKVKDVEADGTAEEVELED